jgi:hypothetical protein
LHATDQAVPLPATSHVGCGASATGLAPGDTDIRVTAGAAWTGALVVTVKAAVPLAPGQTSSAAPAAMVAVTAVSGVTVSATSAVTGSQVSWLSP